MRLGWMYVLITEGDARRMRQGRPPPRWRRRDEVNPQTAPPGYTRVKERAATVCTSLKPDPPGF